MRILVQRRADGVGDWLFMLACIKHYNAQASDVMFYVDFELRARSNVDRSLPPIIRQAFEASDVTWYRADDLAGIEFDLVIPHVVYKIREDVPYLESMLANLVSQIGRDVRYNPELLPRFIFPELADRPRKYMVTVSQGKRETAHKDWQRSRFAELTYEISKRGVDVVHLGLTGDARLTYATRAFMGCSFDTVAGALAGAGLFVGLENGLAVLASWLGIPTVVLYMGGAYQGTDTRINRWSGPAIARMVRPGVADVLAIARKELKC
ncbi:MAG TPA: hypothetical protein VE907_06260 [Gammaproteobacteria bacterium]|nr:hypothetical protein [Gammaproteobacteria bacterium]